MAEDNGSERGGSSNVTHSRLGDGLANLLLFAAGAADVGVSEPQATTIDDRWTGPFRCASAQTQVSALDALNSAVELADASFCPTGSQKVFFGQDANASATDWDY